MLDSLSTQQFAYAFGLSDDVHNEEDLGCRVFRQEQLTDMQQKADKLAELARDRLARLEQPVD